MCCTSNIYEIKELKRELLINSVSEATLDSVQEQKMTSLWAFSMHHQDICVSEQRQFSNIFILSDWNIWSIIKCQVLYLSMSEYFLDWI